MTKTTVKHNLDNIPDELKVLKQWVVASDLKRPINAKTGGPASITDPETWSSYEVARKVVLSDKYKYAGFVFTESDPYTGVDLDHVISPETSEIEPWAQKIIDQMDSYTEVSQSGKGIHIIVRGKKPGITCRRKDGQVEIYEKERYFALTGNISGGRSTIADRQEELEELYYDTFGGAKGSGGKSVGNLVFDPEAKPPEAKLKKLLQSDIVRMTHERRRDLDSDSEYDLALMGYAIRAGWSDQEAVDLVISSRREYRIDRDKKKEGKALQPDYITRTLAKAKHSFMLDSLSFDLEEIIQYGTEYDAQVTVVTKDGKRIEMGSISELLSVRQARVRLWARGYRLPPDAIKHWHQITDAMLPLIKIETTVTTLEETEQWLRNHLSTRYSSILLIDPDNPKLPSNLSKALTTGYGESIIRDKQGRIYLSLNGIIAHARFHLGQSLTQKALAIRLRKMGFERAGVSSDYSGGRVSRVKMWMSPAGYLPPADTNAETPAVSFNLPGDTFSPIEDGEDKDLSLLRPSPTTAEEVARKAKERRNEERV